MAIEGQPTTRHDRKVLYNYGAAFAGVLAGALGGTLLFGPQMNNPPLAAAIGAAVGGVLGFGAPSLVRMMKAH